MDIRTKLALALVFFSLLSMAVLGAFAYQTAASLLQEISIRQLDALAESKLRDLEKVQEGWRDQLRLVKSRTQLRSNLKDYIESGNSQAKQAVVRIIEDAATAVDDVDQIRVMSLDGREVAAYGRVSHEFTHVTPEVPDEIVYNATFPNNAGGARVVFSSLLVLDGAAIGSIEIVFDAQGLRSVTDDYTGLGETGEVMVAMLENDDTVLILNPLRHLDNDGFTRMPIEQASRDVRQAVSGESKQVWLDAEDYRGVHVWAATRYLSELRWGVIVKVDSAEEEERAHSLRDALFDIALALSAFAIVGGTLLGFYLARPIHDLAVLVERIRHGEVELRADASGDDEIAYLAESLNELMDQWKEDSQRNSQKTSENERE